MKRFLTILLTLGCLVTFLTVGILAADDAVPGGTCGDNLTWVLENGVLTISGTGNMSNYNSEGGNYAPWNAYSSDITAVVIEEGVTSIGNGAFAWMENITCVTMPEGLLTIGTNAFYYCEAMTEAQIPGTVMEIGSGAFSCCYELTSVTIPAQIPVIYSGTFFNCKKLSQVTLPTGLTSVGDFAFYRCASLTDIEIPAGVTDFGEKAFGFDMIQELGSPAEEVKVEGFTIYGIPGSGAETYAIENGFRFVDLNAYDENPFEDISSDSYYYDAVLWAYDHNITQGATTTMFLPDGVCTRAQVVTFLWRLAGEPEAENRTISFTDVPETEYYHEAVLWAVENGITVGTSGTTFSPDAMCTRAQIVTFLHRYAQEPAVQDANNPFVDVAEREYYYEAVLWAVENGITVGTSNITFTPDAKCTRGQVVTFLYRYVS